MRLVACCQRLPHALRLLMLPYSPGISKMRTIRWWCSYGGMHLLLLEATLR